MSLLEKAEEGGPTTRELIEEMHRNLGSRRWPVQNSDAVENEENSKIIRVKFFQDFIRRLWKDWMEPHVEKFGGSLGLMKEDGKTPIDLAIVEADIAQLSSPHAVTMHLRALMDRLIGHTLSYYYIAHQFHEEEGDKSPEIQQFRAMNDIVNRTDRAAGIRRQIGSHGHDALDLMKAGFNSLREITWKSFGVIPALSREKYDHEITGAELREVCGSSLHFIHALSTANIEPFTAITGILRGSDDVDSYDFRHFKIVRRKGNRLTLDINADVIAEAWSKSKTAEVRTGCPGALIIADMHRWCMRIADVLYFPHVDRLNQTFQVQRRQSA